MRHNYICAPYTIYEGIYKLLPGHYLQIDSHHAKLQHSLKCYWSISETFEKTRSKQFSMSDTKTIGHLGKLISESIERQTISDVPIGAFLQGGSSLVVALMQEQTIKPVNTFTIGFEDQRYNEAIFARQIAKYLKTAHTELYVSSRDALDVIPQLPQIFDEPFADPSQIPSNLVSNMCSKQVSVALSGDGGDELFGGYARYSQSNNLWSALSNYLLQLEVCFRSNIISANYGSAIYQ